MNNQKKNLKSFDEAEALSSEIYKFYKEIDQPKPILMTLNSLARVHDLTKFLAQRVSKF